MIKLSQAIIVEGKYDKIKLSSIVDTVIIQVNGFQIYKDKEKAELIKYLANTCGIIIMTDSDSAGLILRNKIKEIAIGGEIYNAYIPEILGKERRKAEPSKAGILGVEGVSKDIIISALEKCGVQNGTTIAATDEITDVTLYNSGLTGKADSKRIRTALLKHLGLPSGLSKNNLLKILQIQMSKTQLKNILDEFKEVT